LATYTERQKELALREEAVRVCRLMWEKGFVSASDGNVSVRLDKNHLLTTPTGVSKGFLSPSDVVLIDNAGQTGRQPGMGRNLPQPSSEILLHLEVYRQRPDVQAVVHAHPPLAIAFTIAGISLAQCVLPEVVINLGSIPTTAYATPSSSEGPVVIRELIRDHDALIIDRHGSVTVGPTLFDAYMKLEKLEHLAHVTLAARQLGRVTELPPEEVRKLVAVRRKTLGLPPEYEGPGCVSCGACGKGGKGEVSGSACVDELVRRVAESVMRQVRKQLS